jgi:hypothetical protein
MEYDYTSKTKFVEFSRIRYSDNDYQLGLIDQFNETYNQELAIWWYTKESFLYSMLNRSLRIQDIEVLLKMGFFIHDLDRQITQLYKEQSKDQSPFTVYRGQGILLSDFDKIKNSEGGLISFNNFLSTSLDSDVSSEFTLSAYTNPNVVAVLFQMQIDPKQSSIPFAALDNVSSYKSEREILFSMHTVFRLGKMN